MSSHRGRKRSAVSGFQDLVCFSDGSLNELSAGAILHTPVDGERAHDGNVIQEMRCVITNSASSQAFWHQGLTAGAMELAGLALSFNLLSNYVAAVCGTATSGVQPGAQNVSVYSDDLPIVYFVLQGGAAHAGAQHLEGLVGHVRGLLDELQHDGRQVFLLHAPRHTQGIRRAHALCRRGEVSEWPHGLRDLLVTSSEVYLAASAEDQSVMRKY